MDALCEVWLKLAQCRFWILANVFLLFRYYLPLEKGCDPSLNKLETLFGWNQLIASGEDFLICQGMIVFSNYLPLEKSVALLLIKFVSPLPNNV